MTQHPTEARKIAQEGGEAAGTDILARARSLHGTNWFLPGGEINLPAVLEASNVLGELADEVERLRGALNGLADGWASCDEIAECLRGGCWESFRECAEQLRAVLRGDQ